MKPIYLDYAATTPVDLSVVTEMQDCLTRETSYGNPASHHFYGQAAREKVEIAREKIAATIGARPDEIIFTSGATEANNLALKGTAHLLQRKGKHIITMKTEHKSVLDPCQQLEKEGFALTYLNPDAGGLLSLSTLMKALRQDTILVSIMHVNNETGVIQDIQAIAEMLNLRGISLHSDAAQSTGKVTIDLKKMPINLLSLCAHKLYGPKGIGALFLRRKPRVRVMPLIHGGGHEQGMRSGTLPTHQIVGMGESFQLAHKTLANETKRITALRDLFLAELREIPQMKRNVDTKQTVPHILNLRFDGLLAKALLDQMPTIAASQASACLGKGIEGSYVLRALGLTEADIQSSIRFSFGRFTTREEILQASAIIKKCFSG